MKSFGATHVSMTATVRLGARPTDKAAAIRFRKPGRGTRFIVRLPAKGTEK